MHYDYSRLIGKIVEKFNTRKNFATAMNMSVTSVSEKLNGKKQFRQNEIVRAVDLLGIPADEVKDYFFTLKVQNN